MTNKTVTIPLELAEKAVEFMLEAGWEMIASEFEDILAAPAVERQEPVACNHEWTDDGEFLLICTACGAKEDFEQALQLAFELGGTDDGAYLLEADELCDVIRKYTSPPASVAVVLPDPRQSLESFMLAQPDEDACFKGPYASAHNNAALFYWTAALEKFKELNQ